MSNPMTTPPLDLPAARKIAEEAAYDAPWTYKQGFKTGGARVANTSGFDLPGCFSCGENDGVYEETTARHITAFDPPTVLALITRSEAAARDLAAVTVSRDGWQTRAEAAEKKVAAVRELHAASPCEPECCLLDTCNECLNTHPCPTITALDNHTPETETP